MHGRYRHEMERDDDGAEPPPAVGRLSPTWRLTEEPTRPVPSWMFALGAPRLARIVLPLATLTVAGAVLVYLNAFTRQTPAPLLPIWVAIAVPSIGLGWVHVIGGAAVRAVPRPVSARFQGASVGDVLGRSTPRIAVIGLSIASCMVAASIASSRFPQPAPTPGRCEAILNQGGERTCVDAAELHAYQAGDQASAAAWASVFAIVSLGAAAATLDQHETK